MKQASNIILADDPQRKDEAWGGTGVGRYLLTWNATEQKNVQHDLSGRLFCVRASGKNANPSGTSAHYTQLLRVTGQAGVRPHVPYSVYAPQGGRAGVPPLRNRPC